MRLKEALISGIGRLTAAHVGSGEWISLSLPLC